MLEVTSLTAGYAHGPDVLHDASIFVGDGEAVALIGLNGAGKSTLVRSICGLLPVRSGSVVFEGRDITASTADERARLGILHVPEGRALCPTMTVEENLAIGTNPLPRRERRRRAEENRAQVFELFPILADRRKQTAGSLSGGQQQMVAIGRALISAPRLLVLDEPSLGLAPLLVHEIFQSLRRLSQAGLSILLVEQNASIALSFSDRAYHLALGRVSAIDPDHELASMVAQPLSSAAERGRVEALRLPDYYRTPSRRTGRRHLFRREAQAR